MQKRLLVLRSDVPAQSLTASADLAQLPTQNATPLEPGVGRKCRILRGLAAVARSYQERGRQIGKCPDKTVFPNYVQERALLRGRARSRTGAPKSLSIPAATFGLI